MHLRDLRRPLEADPVLGDSGVDDPDRHDAGTGSISSWDLSTGVDGPGTRFVVFVAGCPMRCMYCHNPETWHMRDGHLVHADDIAAEVRRYETFLAASKGGFTMSGGEPLLQARFTAEVFERMRASGIHTALDTAGSVQVREDVERVLASTDLVLLDIKSSDPSTFLRVTGHPIDDTLEFAVRLMELHVRTRVRFVLVPGLTDDPANVAGVARTCAELGGIERVEVLGYHRLGVDKYRRLGIPYPLPDTPQPTAAQLDAARAAFTGVGLEVT